MTPAADCTLYYDPEAAHIVFSAFPRFDLVDWEATIAHGLHHDVVERWLHVGSARAAFYERISRKTRNWSADRRGEYWHSADGLAMAYALAPDGALEAVARPLEIGLDHAPARGATIVDWNRQTGRPDAATILLRYDQPRFEAMIESALAVE